MCFFIDLILFLGRILFAFVFAYLGIDQLAHWSRSLEFFKDVPSNTASFLVVTGLLLQFFGAFSLFFGFKTRLGALALLLYVLGTAVWPISLVELMKEGHEPELINFLQQILSVAGLLYVLAVGSGRFSYDWLFGSRSSACSRHVSKESPSEVQKEPSKT